MADEKRYLGRLRVGGERAAQHEISLLEFIGWNEGGGTLKLEGDKNVQAGLTAAGVNQLVENVLGQQSISSLRENPKIGKLAAGVAAMVEVMDGINQRREYVIQSGNGALRPDERGWVDVWSSFSKELALGQAAEIRAATNPKPLPNTVFRLIERTIKEKVLEPGE